jgi:hypothetical protein
MAAAVAIAATIVTAALVHSYATRPSQIVYRGSPTFNLQYSRAVLHRVRPHRGELVRLELHRGKLFASVIVRRLHLPVYAHDVVTGLLPTYTNSYERQLRRASRDFRLRDEGTAGVNSGQGYNVGFRSGPPGHVTWGRDILLVPRQVNVHEGVVLGLRQSKAGAMTKHDVDLVNEVRRTFRSFDFGTDRAPW